MEKVDEYIQRNVLKLLLTLSLIDYHEKITIIGRGILFGICAAATEKQWALSSYT